MKRTKVRSKWLSMIMAVLLCVTGLPSMVFAGQGESPDPSRSILEPQKYVDKILDENERAVLHSTGAQINSDGDGIYVKAGYQITYRIRFGGAQRDGEGFESKVIMTDRLDSQVTFISAEDTFGNSISAAAPQTNIAGGIFKYDSALHTVTWEADPVYLNWDECNIYITVRVDEDAEEKVVNRANFWFSEYGDDKGADTNQVENPIVETNPRKQVTGITTDADQAVTAGNGVEVDRNYKITYQVTFDRLEHWYEEFDWSVVFRDVLDTGATFVEAEDCFGNKINAANPSLTALSGLEFDYDSSSREVNWRWNVWNYQGEKEFEGEAYYIDLTVSVNSQARAKVTNQAAVQYYDEDSLKTNAVENPLRGSGSSGGNRNGYYVVYHSETSGSTVSDGRYSSGTTVTVKNGSIFSAPSGKTFAGWAERDGGSVIYRAGETFTMPSATVNLYAIYRDSDTGSLLNREDHYAYVVGYEDGTVKPGHNISREEVTTIFFRLLADDTRDLYYKKTNTFSDVKPGRWSNIAVSTMANGGIVSGYPNGTFAPQATITRAEVAVIAAQFDDTPYSGSDMFSDISRHWAREYINRAANLGWVSGYENGTFRPDEPITRAEMMTLINQVLDRNPESENDLLDNMVKWPDNRNTSAWYYYQVQEATNSHYYEKNSGTESWTQLRTVRDWAALERD